MHVRPGLLDLLVLLVLVLPALTGCTRPAHLATCPGAGDQVTAPSTRKVLTAAAINPDSLRCNSIVRWETTLDQYAKQIAEGIASHWGTTPDAAQLKKARHHALGYLVRSFYEQTHLHNLGVTALRGLSWRDERGEHPVLVFRSSLIVAGSGPSPCFQTLIQDAHVRHVINLYTGTFPFRDLIEAERRFAEQLGASYHDSAGAPSSNWRQLVEEEKDFAKNLQPASELIARLIREQILRPGGQPPRGNLYFHCAGGMHRSGMIFGVLRRCVNGEPLSEIEAEYKHHVGWSSATEPGGFEALNLRLIREFDCSLLKQSGGAAPGKP